MFRCLRIPASALLLSALLVPTVHAGAAPQLNSSEASVIVTSFVVLSLPLAASMGLSELSKAPFKASERNGRGRGQCGEGEPDDAGPTEGLFADAFERPWRHRRQAEANTEDQQDEGECSGSGGASEDRAPGNGAFAGRGDDRGGDDGGDVRAERSALGWVESGTHRDGRSISGAADAAGVLRLRERL